MLWHVLAGRPDVVVAGLAGRLDRMMLLLLCRITGIRMLWYQGGVPYIREEANQEVQKSRSTESLAASI